MEAIDTSYGAYQFRPFTRGDLRSLVDCVELGILSKQGLLDMLPINIYQVDYQSFLIEQKIIDEPIDNRFEILDL